MMFSSCSPRYQAVLPQGQVVGQDGSRYLVIFPDYGGKRHLFTYNWIYVEGMDVDYKVLEVEVVFKRRDD